MTDLIAKSELLGERYRPRTLLGQGESAQAFLATDTWTSNREVVLKIQLPNSPISAKHLRREYGLLAGLSHPHLLEVYEVFEIPPQDNSLFMNPTEGARLLDQEIFLSVHHWALWAH